MGMMWIWFIPAIAVIVAVVWLVVRSAGGQLATRSSPEEILKRRYAGGELDRDEYERRLADLRK